MPSLNILSSPSGCNIRSIAGTLQNNVRTSIQGSVNALQASAFSIQQAPRDAVVQIRQGLDTVIGSTGIPTNQTQLVSLVSSNVSPAIANAARDAIQGIGLSTANLSLSNLVPFEIPKIPNFPALGEISTLIGAGPKFIAEKVAEYTLLVPPTIPGIPLSIAQAGAALQLIRAISSGNPSELLKALLKNIAQDVLNDLTQDSGISLLRSAMDNTGECNLPILSDVERAANAMSANVADATRQFNLSLTSSTNSILNSIDQLEAAAAQRLEESAQQILEETGGTGDTANLASGNSNNTPNQSPPTN